MNPTKRKPQRLAFTVARLERLQPPERGRVFHHDTGCPGLCLCVTAPATRRSTCTAGPMAGRHRYALTGSRQLASRQAREGHATCWRSWRLVSTCRPFGKARREEPDVQALWQHWEAVAKPRKRSWAEDERQYNAFLKPWAGRRLSAVKKADVQSLHAKIGRKRGPYQANRLLALVCAMFNQAGELGHRGDNPAVGVKKFPEQSRDRFLQADELRAFFDALAAQPEVWQAFFLVGIADRCARRKRAGYAVGRR